MKIQRSKDFYEAHSHSQFSCDHNDRYAVINGLPVAGGGTPSLSGHRSRARPRCEAALDPRLPSGRAVTQDSRRRSGSIKVEHGKMVNVTAESGGPMLADYSARWVRWHGSSGR